MVGKYRYKKAFLLNLPIPYKEALKESEKIEKLVTEIQHKNASKNDFSKEDGELEKLIEKLYDFDDNELDILKR